jgi:hypothetical protein
MTHSVRSRETMCHRGNPAMRSSPFIPCLLLLMAIVSCISCGANNPLASAPSPKSGKVAMLNGRPVFLIDDKPVYPMIHALTDVPSGRWSWEELPQHNIRNFCRQGIRVFQLDVFLEHVWPDPDTLDLTIPRKQIAGVLEVSPEAAVIFRFHLRAPSWWMRAHPEEWVVYADTDYAPEQQYGLLRVIEHDNNPVRRVSMASRKWRDLVSDRFVRFLQAFAATPESNALVGLQVANGVYGEWHNWGFFDNEPDISEPMRHAYVEWTQKRYGDEAGLQAAWNQPDAAFASIQCPDMARRATGGVFRDPVTRQDVIDYYRCMHEVVTDNILHFTRLLKANWPRPIIAGTFYGYYFSTFARQAAGGHLEPHRLLEDPSIDYLSGPQAYGPEAVTVGDPYRSRSLTTTIRLHGKLWLDEMDVEPTIPLLKDESYADRLRDSVADVRRNTAFSYTKGAGLWYYDFNISGVDLDGYQHNMSGSQGNWDHPVVMEQIRLMRKLFQERAVSQPYESEADTLFVYDTESFYYTGSLKNSDPVSNTLVDYNSLAAYRAGIIFDTIHIRDLQRIDLSPYRVVVFNNTFVLEAAQRAFIRDEVATNGRHLVWHYAPGWIDRLGQPAGPAVASELTGMRLIEVDSSAIPEIETNAPIGPSTYSLGDGPIQPLLAIEDPSVGILGRFTHTESPSLGAIGKKAFPSYTSWFISLPSQQSDPLRSILLAAGAHAYGNGDGIFYGGGGVLVLHTKSGGEQSVTLRTRQIINLVLHEGPATVLMDAKSGEILLNAFEPDSEGVQVDYPSVSKKRE